MDEAAAEALLAKLIERGLIEERADEVGPTRRWNARVQAAAERLNQEVARTGAQPAGNPLVLAVAQALRDEQYAEGDFDDAVRVLVTLELTRMSAQKRARYGFDVSL
ncbi:MAG TPA: hypothetical protein VM582_08420 [Candidatus Thermoplasmatota archaeon]|nr:hypothetical protein [Candidatus Thermoplasmatota archaeon]